MANEIKIKRSSVQGKVPTTGALELGELAVNTYDGKLYTKKNDGTDSIVEIGPTETDLSYNSSTRVVASSTGTDVTLPEVTAGGDSGLMTGADKTKLDGIESGATADQTGAEIKAAYEAENDTNAFTDAEQTKLAGIETGATADQTASEIKTLYEGNNDTNAFTDAEQTKLAGIETGATADQTGAEIKTAYEGEANTNAFTDAEKTKLAGIAAGAEVNVDTDLSYTASTRVLASSTGTDATLPEVVASGDSGLMTGSDKSKLDGIESGATADQTASEIKTAYESNSNTNAFTDTEKTKLSGIETGAQVNVATDLGTTRNGSQVNITSSTGTDITIAAATTTLSGVLTASDKTKLDGIEANATADQTGAEIKSAYEAESNTNAFTDAEKTKLAGIETGATADQNASEVSYSPATSGMTATDLQDAVDELDARLDSASSTGGSGSVFWSRSGTTVSPINPGDDVSVNGDISITGTVDGRDLSVDGAKLDGIEASADVTDATNVAAAGAVMESDTSTINMSFVVDEDTMVSNSATKVPTQQSVKAYVDTEVAAVVDSAPGTLDTLNELAAALGDDPNFATTVTNSIASKLPLAGGTMTGNIVMSGSQTVDGRDLSVDGAKLDGIETGATADQTKADIDALGIDAATLDGIDSTSFLRSDAADTKTSGNLIFNDNVEARFGTDSDLRVYHTGSHSYVLQQGTGNLYLRNTTDDSDVIIQSDDGSGGIASYIVANGGTGQVLLYHYGSLKINTNSTGINVTGDIAVSGTVDGRDVATDGTKLDGIESGATADQTASEILTAIKTVDGTASGLDADLLDGQQGSHYLDYNNFTNTPTIPSAYTDSSVDSHLNTSTASSGEVLSWNGSDYDWVAQSSGSTNADTLDSLDSTQFLRSDSVDTFTGGSLTIESYLKIDSATDAKLVMQVDSGDTSDWNYIEFRGANGTRDGYVGTNSTGTMQFVQDGGSYLQLSGTAGTANISGNTIWTSGNDGAGSGLDADTLDGVQGASYLRSDTTDNYTGSRLQFTGTSVSTSHHGSQAWQVSGSDTAWQRCDARDDATNYARLHWYGNDDGGGTSNFRHAWYDGSAYINVTADSSELNFARTSGTTYLQVDGNTVWHTGNDGSGSGLDADLLDGLNSTQFMRTDAFNVTSGQLYIQNTSPALYLQESDTTTRFRILVSDGDTYISAGASGSYTSASSGNLYFEGNNSANIGDFQVKTGGSYNDIWHAGNDGSGSGLDADTLDGLNGTAFVKTSGGTVSSGSLKVNDNISFLVGTGNDLVISSDGTDAIIQTQNNADIYFKDSGTTKITFDMGNGDITAVGEVSADQILLTGSASNVSGAYAIYASLGMFVNGNTVWHAGNDGSGSGLDADTLDGVQGASFLRSDADDTTTGALTIKNTTHTSYTSSDTAITSLVSGSTFGGLIEATGNGHLVVGLRGNDNGDSFSIISGGGNYSTDSTYDTLVFQAKVNGDLYAGNNKIWHAGNDGSSSGLDADTVDGLHSDQSSIRDARADGDITPTNFTDKAASFTFTDDVAGSTRTWDSILTMKGWGGSTYRAWQLIGNASTSTSSDTNLYFRTGIGSSWGSLEKIWTSGNDGSASGLDADTLDGQQGSYYLDYNNFTNTPSAGSSVTTSATAPSSPSDGDLWYDTNGGNLYVYYNDGNSSQWVQANIQTNIQDGSGSGLDADLLDGQQGSYYLDYNNFTNTPTPAYTSYAILEDQKGLGTNGGDFNSGAWRTRDLNTEVADPDGIVSISSNQFTLGAGTYVIQWEAPAMRCSYHASRLYDVTGSSDVAYGTGEYADSVLIMSNRSTGAHRVTLTSSNTYRIEHRCNSTRTSYGFGYTPTWSYGRFTKVKIYKE